MRKWVIGVAWTCIGCFVYGTGAQSDKQPHADEELIITAILVHNHENFRDFHKDGKSAIGVYDQWDPSQGSFETHLSESIDDLAKNLKESGKHENRFVSDPDAQAAQKKYVAKMTDGLGELRKISRQLSNM